MYKAKFFEFDGIKFKAHPEWCGYATSRCGKIISLIRSKPKVLKPYSSSTGYQTVGIVINGHGKQKNISIHKLVLETWFGPCPNNMQALHLNGDPHDNRYCNLKWGTAAENRLDRVRHGTEALFESSSKQMPEEFAELWQNEDMRKEMCEVISEAIREVWQKYACEVR